MLKIDDEHGQDGDLDVVGLDLLAQVFGRPPDHQPGQEDGQDDEDEHPVEPGADAAEDDLAQLDVEQRDEPAQRRERIVHGVDRAAGGVGRDGGEERGIEDAEADLLALHVAAGRIDAERRARRGFPALSAHQQTRTAARKRTAMALQTAQPCLWFLTVRPR